MLKNAIAFLLTAVIALPAQGGQQTSGAIEKQVRQIATGSTVEVRTKLKSKKTVIGRLGEVTAEGFEVENIKLRFADVTSVAEKMRHRKTSPGVWVLAGVGGALLVLVIIGAAVAGK